MSSLESEAMSDPFRFPASDEVPCSAVFPERNEIVYKGICSIMSLGFVSKKVLDSILVQENAEL